MQYRIKKITFPSPELTIYVPQYKILGIWVGIKADNIGCFLWSSKCHCETITEAVRRISFHKNTMKRSNFKQYVYKETEIIYKTK